MGGAVKDEHCSPRLAQGQSGNHDVWQHGASHSSCSFCSCRSVLRGADSTVLHIRIDESVVRAVCSSWAVAVVGGGCDVYGVWAYVGVCAACRYQRKLVSFSQRF